MQVLRDEAEKFEFPKKISVDRLKELIQHPNRFIRAEALLTTYGRVANGDETYVTIIADSIGDPDLKVRGSAVIFLSKHKGKEVLMALPQRR